MANTKTLNPSAQLPAVVPLNMRGQQVFNVAPPTDTDDVVTLRYFNENAGGSTYDLTVTFGTTTTSMPTGATVNLMNNTIQLDSSPIPDGVDVFWNGALLIPATHYTLSNGLFTLVGGFTFAAQSNDCFTFRRN